MVFSAYLGKSDQEIFIKMQNLVCLMACISNFAGYLDVITVSIHAAECVTGIFICRHIHICHNDARIQTAC